MKGFCSWELLAKTVKHPKVVPTIFCKVVPIIFFSVFGLNHKNSRPRPNWKNSLLSPGWQRSGWEKLTSNRPMPMKGATTPTPVDMRVPDTRVLTPCATGVGPARSTTFPAFRKPCDEVGGERVRVLCG